MWKKLNVRKESNVKWNIRSNVTKYKVWQKFYKSSNVTKLKCEKRWTVTKDEIWLKIK